MTAQDAGHARLSPRHVPLRGQAPSPAEAAEQTAAELAV